MLFSLCGGVAYLARNAGRRQTIFEAVLAED
jgi:hypothetical protein